jgi:hypothetical protein
MATIKMDGENTTMMRDVIHARSLDSRDHESRHWVKTLWSQIKGDIPENWRICGENLYAKHSIYYENLINYFQVFSIWDENDICLDWRSTIEWCELLNLSTVEVIKYPLNSINYLEFHKYFVDKYSNTNEGYVIRNVEKFSNKDFSTNVAKYVRPNHIQTNEHWMYDKIIKNKLYNLEG